MVSVAFFGVRVSVMFHTLCLFIILLVGFGLLSGHLLGNSCPLGWPYVLIVYLYFWVFSHFGFKTGIRLLIAPASSCSLLFYYSYTMIKRSELRTEP